MRALTFTCAAVVAAAAVCATTLPASAATQAAAPGSGPVSALRQIGMSYDPPTAVLGGAASGHVLVRLADGEKISVPAAEKAVIMQAIARGKSDPTIASAASYHRHKDTVRGDCGYSWIQIADKKPGNHPLTMKTGFHVNKPAISYSWATDTFNHTGFKKPWGAAGTLADRSAWAGGFRTIRNYRHGDYVGLVYAAKSWAVLNNGDVCVSGGPVASGYL